MANNYLINKSSVYSSQSKDRKSYIDNMRRPFTMNIETLPRTNNEQPQTGIGVSLSYVITDYVDEGYVDNE